jgi:hypothetical protein
VARHIVESTEAAGSPVTVQGASAAECWSTYEGLMVEHAKWSGEADRRWAAYERLVSENERRQEMAYASYAEASRQEDSCWNEARAAYAAWKTTAGT